MSETTQQVHAWTEALSIPTYGIGEPERNPMFLEKRVYQGSSGKGYPLPVSSTASKTRSVTKFIKPYSLKTTF